MFCPKCGKENVDDAVVCVGCGRAIQAVQAATMTMEKPWSTGKMVLYGIFSFVFPLIGVIGGIYGLVRPEKRKQGATLLSLAILGIVFWTSVFK